MDLKKKVIAFDMDGTLLNNKKKISLLTKLYLKKLSRKGHIIVLASGRPSRALYKYYNELKLKTPMICYNGAYVFNPHDSKFPKIEFEFPKKTILDVIDRIKPHIKTVMCESDTEIWVDKKDDYLAKFFWYEGMDIHYGELKDTLNKNPMTCIVQTPFEYRDKSEIESVLKNNPELGVRFWTGSPYFELFYKGTSKGNALKTICKYYGLTTEDLIVFGDAENDVEMFNVAGVSVLMKNSTYNLADKTTYISKKDNNHNGIYYTLKEIIK
mgnify:CR=1 FL=1